MATFDLKTFLEMQGQGQGAFTSVGTAFGMPSCMLNLGNDILRLLPSSILGAIGADADEARFKTQELIAESLKLLTLRTGIIEYDTETGLIRFGSDSSDIGSDADKGSLLTDLGGLLGAAGAVAAVGGQLYRNYQTTQAQIDGIIDCFSSYEKITQYQDGLSSEKKQELSNLDQAAYQAAVEAEYGRYIRQLRTAKTKLSEIDRLRSAIERELLSRYQNPDLEPEFDPSLYEFLRNSRFRISDPDGDPEESDESIIRLTYGPPKTSQGQFVLTVDGLYYDSQTSGLDPVLLFIKDNEALVRNAEKWKLEFDPNLGGKGEQLSSRTFDKWVDSIFDLNQVDESKAIQEYYDKDHFLQVLIGQKEKRILDLSGHIGDLVSSGVSTAIIQNFKQSLLSEVAYHNDKINRRKKQIEIAVKTPSIFGKGQTFKPGEIPINNFSYLQDCNISLALNKQRELILNQEDVSGVVLPIKPVFVITKDSTTNQTIEHLVVPQVGIGAIINDSNNANETSGLKLGITDVVTTDGLFAIYNYLESNVVAPSSSEYKVTNCVSLDNYNNGQLVATTTSSVFRFGLASAYLRGITVNSGTSPSALGSYIKLPDTSEFQEWCYSNDGMTFETWINVPYLNDLERGWEEMGVSSLYRLVLANENTGRSLGAVRTEDYNSIPYSDGIDYPKGLIMGFTRDRRWSAKLNPSNDRMANHPLSGVGFVIAPTIAYDSTSVGFISKPLDDCGAQDGWRGMYINASSVTTITGKSLLDCCNRFCNIAVTLNYGTDEIKVYLDAELLATSSISEVFGSTKYQPISLPTFKKSNSFEYNTTSVGSLAPNSLKYGPKLNSYFTPWILGGGYTDGMANYGNFMGGSFGGITSGLRGYLGSTKFYNRYLNIDELAFNYDVQSDLFKYIETPATLWVGP